MLSHIPQGGSIICYLSQGGTNSMSSISGIYDREKCHLYKGYNKSYYSGS